MKKKIALILVVILVLSLALLVAPAAAKESPGDYADTGKSVPCTFKGGEALGTPCLLDNPGKPDYTYVYMGEFRVGDADPAALLKANEMTQVMYMQLANHRDFNDHANDTYFLWIEAAPNTATFWQIFVDLR